MQWVIVQAMLTFAVSAGLAVFVSLQRPRTRSHDLVLALLVSFMLWTAGVILIHGAETPLSRRLATTMVFAGVVFVSPIWLYLCAYLAHARVVLDHPRASLASLLTPGVAMVTLVATDGSHGLFASGETSAIFHTPVSAWAGPAFWAHALWSYACTFSGISVALATARRAVNPIERKRLLLVAAAAAIPVFTTVVLVTGLIPPHVRITPGDVGVCGLLLVTAVVRYRFLDPSPIPVSEVISHLEDGLVIAGADARVVDASPRATVLLGESLASLRGRPLGELLDAIGAGDLEQGAGRRTVHTRDDRVLDVSAGRVSDASGRAAGSFLVLRDRTEAHRDERHRQQAQRLQSLGVLAAGIAHEINNPLAFVRTNLAHLAQMAGIVRKRADAFAPDERTEVAELEEVIQETQAGVDRIARIVEGTRRLSREPSRSFAPVDLNRAVRLALQLADLHRRSGAVVEASLAVDLPQPQGSAERLGQVLLNLMINAKQAIADGGHIRVETRAVSGGVEVRVHDDGPGVPAEARERIFDPFFTTKDPDEGTGLGLAIAYEIAREHEGRLELRASDLGGACFVLALPVRPAAA